MLGSQVRAICFDAFGTLCYIGDRRDAYAKLLEQFDLKTRDGMRATMRSQASFGSYARSLAKHTLIDIAGLKAELDQELASIALFDESAAVLQDAVAAGWKCWVISNLATPYAAPVRKLLDGLVSGYSFSCEVGWCKPEADIFAHACAGLEVPRQAVLMVGDSLRSDVEGGQKFGMHTVHLDRKATTDWPTRVASLRELIDTLRETK